MNKIVLIGRLTKDVEVRYTQSNVPVASFTLAVNRRFKQEGQPDADFINVVAWNKTAEFCSNYFNKGQQIGLVGRIQTRNYEKEDGTKVYITEVVAEEVYFAGEKKEEHGEAYEEPTATVSDDELPF